MWRIYFLGTSSRTSIPRIYFILFFRTMTWKASFCPLGYWKTVNVFLRHGWLMIQTNKNGSTLWSNGRVKINTFVLLILENGSVGKIFILFFVTTYFYPFVTSAQDRGECFTPGRGPRYPLHRLRWAPAPVWTQRLEGKSSAPVGDSTRSSRLVL